ncbi:hypothetical protein MNBD_GAMMA04-155 [hydrothermal vent metagenome]|uniref:Uncharacterized protein n=1 Tax=hydrothermal vent metagenome TaxID=652676 RepID=A0A3B0WK66_9ZZZZ
MRVETDYDFLMYFIAGLLVVLALGKINIPNKVYKTILAFMVAITMPLFIPGHGEIIMLIPTGSMYAVSSTEAKVLGVIFTIINYFIARFILYRVCGLLKCERGQA